MRLRGVGVCVGSRWQTATASPRPPKARRRGHRQGSPPALGPTQSRQGRAHRNRGEITWRLLGIIGAFFGVFLRFDAQRIFE
jgi:hypothetical protein